MTKSSIASRIFLCLCLLSMLFAPLSAQAVTLDMMGLERDETDRSWADSHFFTRMEAITGTGFTFRQYSDADEYAKAKAAAFDNGGDLPDVLFKAYLTPEEEMAYHASGQLVDLAPLLEEHAPNLFAILEARPDWRAAITQPDGAITSLPILNGADRQAVLWINDAWLQTLGLSMPATIDAFTDVLRAMRDGDPNQNGRADEVPLALIGPWEAKFLLHAWGLVPNDYNIYADDGGTVHFAPLEDGFRAFCDWLRMAQAEGLLDADAFRTTHAARSAQVSTASSSNSETPITYGVLLSMAPYTQVDMEKTTQYAALPPLMHDGAQTYRQLLSGVGRGTFAITTACEDIPAALAWADYLYTEDGGRLAFAGEAGVDYTVTPEGAWAWEAGEDYLGLTDLVNNSLIAGDAVTPGLEPAAFMRNSEIAADNYARRQTDAIRDTMKAPFPATWPTNAERETRIAALQAALATRVDTWIGSYALGKEADSDEAWAAFYAELEALGATEFTALWQEVYDEQ